MARAPYYASGRYWGKITHQALTESSNGNPQVVVTFEVLGLVDPDNPDGDLLPCGQRNERSIFRAITAKTAEWVADDLRKLGFTSNKPSDVDLDSATCCDLRGNEAAFWCDHEPHYKTGEQQERWKVASDSPGLQVKPLEAKEVRKLDAMFGRFLKDKPVQTAPTAKAAAPAAKPAPKATKKDLEELNEKFDESMDAESAAPDDDIPF